MLKLERTFMNSKRPNELLKSKETNFKHLLKKLKLPLKPKNLRLFAPKLNFNSSRLILTEDLPKKMKKLIILEEMPVVPLKPSKDNLMLKSEAVPKPFVLRRSLKVTFLILKSNSPTQQDNISMLNGPIKTSSHS